MSVRLSWPSRDDAPIDTRGARLVRDEPAEPSSVGRVIAGDNLEVLRALREEGLAGAIDVAYLDPPYMSGVDYALEGRGGDRTHAYGDRWATSGDYLDMLFPRLRLIHALLAETGTIWVQVDHRASFLVHALLDEIFGPSRFRNAIVWRRAPPLGRQVQSGQFPRNVDTLIAYARGDRPKFRPIRTSAPIEQGKARYDEARKEWFTLAPRGDYTDASIARLELEGRVHRTPSGKVYIKYFLEQAADGSLMKSRAVDSMWDDIAPLRHVSLKERTGYPTQKPERLIERVLSATSDAGDLVLDPFSGSGTTAVVAARGGRRFIAIDGSPIAITTSCARLRRENVPFSLERTPTWNGEDAPAEGRGRRAIYRKIKAERAP